MIERNYLDHHNSYNLNFRLEKQTSASGQDVYCIIISTEVFPHNFPSNAIMHLTLDGQPFIKLIANESDKVDYTYNSYSPGYMQYNKGGSYYVPGHLNSIHVRKDFVAFPVEKSLLEQIEKAKKLEFSIEGTTQKLNGEFSPENFLPIKSFVSECIHGVKLKKEN